MPTKYENNRLKTGLASAAVLCVGPRALTAMTAMSPPHRRRSPATTARVEGRSATETSTQSPDNHPHVGCTFQLEWYGFDADVTVDGPLRGAGADDRCRHDRRGPTPPSALDGDPGPEPAATGLDGTRGLHPVVHRCPAPAAGLPRQADHRHA